MPYSIARSPWHPGGGQDYLGIKYLFNISSYSSDPDRLRIMHFIRLLTRTTQWRGWSHLTLPSFARCASTSPLPPLGRGLIGSPTAPAERAPSERARSASTESGRLLPPQTRPFEETRHSPFFHPLPHLTVTPRLPIAGTATLVCDSLNAQSIACDTVV